MEKIAFFAIVGVLFLFISVSSVQAIDPGTRRITTEIEIVQGGNIIIAPAPNGFTSYDLTQAIQNKYRLFLRGTILNQ